MKIVAPAFLVFSICYWSAFALNIERENQRSSLRVLYTKNVNITTQNQRVTSINNEPAEIVLVQNLKQIRIFRQTLYYMPVGLEQFCPNLENLEVFSSKLKSIEKSDLEVFPHLWHISLEENDLVTLSSDLFSKNLQLANIVLGKNKIKTVGENTFANLKRLRYLNLNDNLCINLWANGIANVPELLEKVKQNCLLTSVTTSQRAPGIEETTTAIVFDPVDLS